MKNLKKLSLEAHKKSRGKLKIVSKVPLKTRKDMSLFYTPGVAEPCKEIAKSKERSFDYTSRGNMIAVVTDGSAVLGLGNIGALAGMPVMEGKCALFKKFGGVDAFPIGLDTQDVDEIVDTVKRIAPSFGGINLEDISAPRCFEIEERLGHELDIPVMHDDQHATAIVCLAGLINALKITGKKKDSVHIVVAGAGAAGIAIAKLMLDYGFKHIILTDSRGALYKGRSGLDNTKKEILKVTNLKNVKGGLADAVKGADIFIGVSVPNILTKAMVRTMAPDPILFPMSNPDPEIKVEDAYKASAKIVATGRSDYPNQINNVLVFPGIFRGLLDARAKHVTKQIKLAAAEALAKLVKNPTPKRIIPNVFDKGVAEAVAKAVKQCK